jgi:hypothetical protein
VRAANAHLRARFAAAALACLAHTALWCVTRGALRGPAGAGSRCSRWASWRPAQRLRSACSGSTEGRGGGWRRSRAARRRASKCAAAGTRPRCPALRLADCVLPPQSTENVCTHATYVGGRFCVLSRMVGCKNPSFWRRSAAYACGPPAPPLLQPSGCCSYDVAGDEAGPSRMGIIRHTTARAAPSHTCERAPPGPARRRSVGHARCSARHRPAAPAPQRPHCRRPQLPCRFVDGRGTSAPFERVPTMMTMETELGTQTITSAKCLTDSV